MTTEERLEKLERQMAAMKDGEGIRAAGFSLVDAQGRVRAALQMTGHGPSLSLAIR